MIASAAAASEQKSVPVDGLARRCLGKGGGRGLGCGIGRSGRHGRKQALPDVAGDRGAKTVEA